ncbi:YrhB domain-containing protein [Streptomyces eurythermus]|uniref:YrhB domain-containing protein n=1 Tax=Streptomyces eurythermus TaxID=42237 RepID=UPI0036D2299B
MKDRDAAVRIVRKELERQDRRWSAVVPGRLPATVTGVEEHGPEWIAYWNSEEFARTGTPSAMPVGNGPSLADRVDGGPHRTAVVRSRRAAGITHRTAALASSSAHAASRPSGSARVAAPAALGRRYACPVARRNSVRCRSGESTS